ncbi:transcription factor adf-1 [Plakobranchus ocellatus]|uniref:Transcription factor adf-1 n=1 Tax=Plakobranchus ocellatus TaxID=259542 RepID=A0AAV4AUE7_9GAST|nr:transcription factor adf-1 [Plakobranchus ocellatus]
MCFLLSSSATVCKVKWQSLRDYFLRKRRENAKKSGQAASTKRQWYLYERMSFLNPFVAARESSGNLDSVPIADESLVIQESQADSQPSSESPQLQFESLNDSQNNASTASNSGRQKKRKHETEEIDREIIKALKQEPENEHELFFKSLIPTVSQLDPINTMLFQAEVQHLAVKYLREQQLCRPSTSGSAPQHPNTRGEGNFYEQYYTSSEAGNSF